MQILENIRREILQIIQKDGSNVGLVVKWQANEDNFDLAFRMHAFQLSDSTAASLISTLKASFSEISAIEFEEGYLNLRFSDQAWHRLTDIWAQDATAFWAAAGLRQTFDPNLDPQQKILLSKDIHFLAHARAVSEIPGWQIAADNTIPLQRDELMVLKEILRLGTGKAISIDERTRKAKALVLAMRKLWQSPILIPTDAQGSALRQKILHLGLSAATALLGESIQTAPVE